MKKVLFEKNDLLWLYFYLWQIELSIDRALHNGWEDMVDFLDSRVQLKKVMFKLEQNMSDETKKESIEQYFPEHHYLTYIYRRMFSKCFLYEDEYGYIFSTLQTYGKYRKVSSPPDSELLIKLRMQINDAKGIIQRSIGYKHIQSYGYVSHFNSSEHIETKELDEIITKQK